MTQISDFRGRAYLALCSARFRTLIQYRAAAVAGAGTQLFFGLIRVMIFDAFYRSSTAPMPLSREDTITYLWLGQALFAMLPYTANPDPDVRASIRSGGIAYELARPLDLYWHWYVRALAARLAPTLLRSGPLILVAMLFFGMRFPPSLIAGSAWILATGGALLLIASVVNIMTISLLWTLSGDGITRIMPSLMLLLSGMIIPLPLYPAWAQPLLNFLPFRGMVDAPFRLYLGSLPPSALIGVLSHQLAWTLALILLGRWLLSRGMRLLVVQGG